MTFREILAETPDLKEYRPSGDQSYSAFKAMVFFIYTDRLADYPDVNELGTLLPELLSLAAQYKLSGFQSCLEVRDVSKAFFA